MSIQTICLRLRSEKIRERKDGRKELTELLDKDRIEECVPLKYGQELIVAAMLYENSEIKHVKANNELAADASSKKTWKCSHCSRNQNSKRTAQYLTTSSSSSS